MVNPVRNNGRFTVATGGTEPSASETTPNRRKSLIFSNGVKKIYVRNGSTFRSHAPLRMDFVGMSDFFPACGRNINVCLKGLNAELYATFRSDKMVVIEAGAFGHARMSLDEIYQREFKPKDPMFFKALRMYPEHRLESGVTVQIDCQYGAGGLSTSSSVAGAIHALLERIFNIPSDPMATVWRVIKTEPHSYGRQDQLAVIFGSINMWEMQSEKFDIRLMKPESFSSGNVKRYPLFLGGDALKILEETVLIYESGIEKGAEAILSSVAGEYLNDPKKMQRKFDRINDLALKIWQVLGSRFSTSAELAEELGPMLNEVRRAHLKLHKDVTNRRMEDLFAAAKKASATGGRINGAGGRGTIQLCVPSHLRAQVEAALDEVDTPGPGSDKKLKGHLVRYEGFDLQGARCWATKF